MKAKAKIFAIFNITDNFSTTQSKFIGFRYEDI
jgi:hypothetical protein